MRRVRVAVGRAPYDVLIGEGAVHGPQLRRCLGKGASGIVVSSARVMRLHGRALTQALDRAGFKAPVFLLRDGEAAKTTREWERTMGAMAKAGLDRSSFVIAFGGGSIGDAAGFAAATYMRGLRFIQIPTTLLAMVDSSVGGKTGVNLKAGKNLVGSFHQPSLVLADLAFLRTLPDRERQSGVFEIVKCGLLRSRALLELIERTRGLRRAAVEDLETAIAGAVTIKARIVESDEKESGDRILLNLGHTLGHALEAATAYRLFTHGEAVGHGLDFAVDLSETLGLTGAAAAKSMRASILAVGPRRPIRPAMVAPARKATFKDKKRAGATLREVLLEGPQKPSVVTMEAEVFAEEARRWLSKKAAGTRRVRGA